MKLRILLLSIPAFAMAQAPGRATSGAGLTPEVGHYACSTFTFSAGGLNATISALGRGIDILPTGGYRALGETGKYHLDASSDRIVWDSGPLAKAVGHIGRQANGKLKITFNQKENAHAIDGHEIDHGPTACYLK